MASRMLLLVAGRTRAEERVLAVAFAVAVMGLVAAALSAVASIVTDPTEPDRITASIFPWLGIAVMPAGTVLTFLVAKIRLRVDAVRSDVDATPLRT